MIKSLSIIFASSLCAPITAQNSFFNTIMVGKGTKIEAQKVIEKTNNIIAESEPVLTAKGKFDDYTIQELEWMINEYVKRKEEKVREKKRGFKIWRLYDEEEEKPLNMKNLMTVMEKVGLSNKLHVLAQAVLETGWFKSEICRSYNNLFGLYDSKTKDYYHFERWEDSVVGYKKFIQYKYKGGNYFMFLQRIGYAEDPQYISKIAKVMRCIVKENNKKI